jgi:Ca-activated chloride channel homolog
MAFAQPWALLLLVSVPLVLAGHLWLQRRRRKMTIRVSSAALIRAARPPTSRWRRHVPIAAFLAALAALGLAGARPTTSVAVPLSRTTIILALDVSRSMCSTDVAPNRLVAAQDAARAFVDTQVGGTRIGLVAFTGLASLVVAPTTDHDRLKDAIADLTTARGTAIGMAILASLDAIAEINPDVAPTGIDVTTNVGGDTAARDAAGEMDDAADGEFVPDVVVLLTDGANSQGVEPVTAAHQAVERRVRVYTIGFGTTDSAPSVCTAEQLGGDALGGPFGGGASGTGDVGGPPQRVVEIDEQALTAVAEMTGGTYYRAEQAEQLTEILTSLPRQVELQHEEIELGVWFTLAGAVLAVTAVGLSLAWNRSP